MRGHLPQGAFVSGVQTTIHVTKATRKRNIAHDRCYEGYEET